MMLLVEKTLRYSVKFLHEFNMKKSPQSDLINPKKISGCVLNIPVLQFLRSYIIYNWLIAHTGEFELH